MLVSPRPVLALPLLVSACLLACAPEPVSPGIGPDAAMAAGADARTTDPRTADAAQPSDRADARTSQSTGCTDALICDGFEDAAPGGAPDPAIWSIVTGCGGGGIGRVTVDDEHAYSGSRSIRVSGGSSYCDHAFLSTTAIAGAAGPIFGRCYVRLDDALGEAHTTLATMHDSVEDKDVRIGGQQRILMWNRESDDATLPELSPAGISQSVTLAPDTWTCVEFTIDGANGTMQTWVNGAEVAGLTLDGTPTPEIDSQWLRNANWRPELSDFRLGWESYGAQGMTLWFDDVALGPTRIGCGG